MRVGLSTSILGNTSSRSPPNLDDAVPFEHVEEHVPRCDVQFTRADAVGTGNLKGVQCCDDFHLYPPDFRGIINRRLLAGRLFGGVEGLF